MPCDTVQLNSLEIGKMNPKLLAAALVQMGAVNIRVDAIGRASFTLEGVRCELGGGRLRLPAGFEGIGDRVKVAYSRQAVLYSAKKNGWTIKETRPNVFAVTK